MSAPGTTARFGSRTVPDTVPVPVWASAMEASNGRAINPANKEWTLRNFISHLVILISIVDTRAITLKRTNQNKLLHTRDGTFIQMGPGGDKLPPGMLKTQA